MIVDILVDRIMGLLVLWRVSSSLVLVRLVEVILWVMMFRFFRNLMLGIFYGEVN